MLDLFHQKRSLPRSPRYMLYRILWMNCYPNDPTTQGVNLMLGVSKRGDLRRNIATTNERTSGVQVDGTVLYKSNPDC